MKRVFLLIITLIILSLFGLIYLQVEWISGAMKLKREQYDSDIYFCLQNIKDSINRRKDKATIGFSFQFQPLSFSNYVPTSSVLSNYQVKDIIRSELRKKNIKQPFEYCITNEVQLPILYSSGYKMEYLDPTKTSNNHKTILSGENIINNETLNVYIVEPENYFKNHLATLLIFAALFTSIIIAAFVLTIRTMLSQKKLSEIKSDFINNMTHEFKTPIATIQLASDALNNEKVISNEEQIRYYSGIIKEENRRMNKQVEKILQAAQLERDEIKLQLKKIDVHQIIAKVAEHTKLQMEEIGAAFETQLQAQSTTILADEVHFTNIMYNLVDNAIKYSKENPRIRIATKNVGNQIEIKVADNGIGMDKETVGHIFEKFFRAHTGNIHNVKGFGLGLTYVKNIVQAHRGKVEVSSEPGIGSTFTLYFQCQS
ncbi:MAG: HAMP domain-containing histidine kinase [Chitinophagaceae bacterium]|nr:HAMP domain-containing histidine kinase [Chitinophagaceae bacterium]